MQDATKSETEEIEETEEGYNLARRRMFVEDMKKKIALRQESHRIASESTNEIQNTNVTNTNDKHEVSFMFEPVFFKVCIVVCINNSLCLESLMSTKSILKEEYVLSHFPLKIVCVLFTISVDFHTSKTIKPYS